MRHLPPMELSQRARNMLAKRRQKVMDQPDAAARKAKAERLWKNKRGAAWDEIRETLRAMASGRQRCMYCEDSEGTDIEHFYPKATYPQYAFDWDNYLLAMAQVGEADYLVTGDKADLLSLQRHGRV